MFALIFLTIVAVIMTGMIGLAFAFAALVANAFPNIVGLLVGLVAFVGYLALLALCWTHVVTGWLHVIHNGVPA